MKRVFLTGTLSLVIVGALAALLAVQAQDSRHSHQLTTQASKPPVNADKPPVKKVGKPAAQTPEVSAIRPKPDYNPEKDPRRPGYMMLKEAEELLRAGDLDAAERECRESLQFFRTYLAGLPKDLPGDATYLTGLPSTVLANILLAKGQYKDALEIYREVTDDFNKVHTVSSSYNIFLNIAFCYIRLGDYEKAKKFYSDKSVLAELDLSREDLPGTHDARSLEASILLVRGTLAQTPKEALANYEPASKLAPRNGMLAYLQALSLMDLKRYDEALPMFTRVVRFGNPAQIKSAKSTMFQRWPRAQAEKAISEAAKIP